ncbi:endonuclease MutS2 [Marinilabiliaceae bacterium JC017]|nr:endonuclease MutS2 [Marinilabiliaceae bacterium JC017]
MIYPTSFEEKIKFTRIRELIKESCLSGLGKEQVDHMQFNTAFDQVKTLLGQTFEFRRICLEEEQFPIGYFIDVRQALKKIRIEGRFMEEKELFDLKRSLTTVRDISRFFNQKTRDEYPYLKDLADQVSIFPFLIERIDFILNKFGKIKDNASPELARIRREIFNKQNSISRRLASILKQAKKSGFVEADVSVAIRDGRAVIPIPSAYKRKLSGIVHDESATGKTSYIEPTEVVTINNEVRELEYAEKREVVKILIEMSDQIRPYIDDLMGSYDFLGVMDFIRAKARFALSIEATLPDIANTPDFKWQKAVHPLLYLQHKAVNKEVVPLEIELKAPEQRILLISGPNAGGKSVCLQTSGLLQYMMQCGLLVPMDEQSKMGFFEHIFIDIGDEQSIENDLSTYSSHLMNMKYFVKNSQAKTLLLIDEFGTGTEPMLGGAIAESVLSQLNSQGVYGVITTHYTNLKHFAAQTEGIENGAMLFDTHRIQPVFQLQIGQPGSSFAFEIARKIGLPENILADAKEKIGQEHIDFDKHLREIVRDKRYYEQKRNSIRINEKKLGDVLERYQLELQNIKKERKEVLDKARRDADNLLSGANKQIENTIRTIRESQAEKEKTKIARQQLDRFKDKATQQKDEGGQIDRKIRQLKEREKRKLQKQGKTPGTQSATAPAAMNDLTIKKGDHVKLEGQPLPGEVMEVMSKEAVVAFGNMMTTVKLSRLEKISRNEYKKEVRGKTQMPASNVAERIRTRKLTFSPEIDVRGQRADEAIQTVMAHVDEAIMCEASSVRILHGKGNGILRQMIREYLATVPLVSSFRDEHLQHGGSGITIVELEG